MNNLSKITIYFSVTLICIGFLSSPCFAFDDGDFQLWTTANASVGINEDWKCTFEQEFKFGDYAGELFYSHSDLGFVYQSLADWIDLGFNYRQVFARKGSADDWKQENRPHLNFTLKGK
ncbi:MAG: porin family protein, partial [Planctomycetota bacterium]